MKKILAFAVLLVGTVSFAQTTSNNGLVTPSIDPVGDSIAIARLRSKMDSVRRTEHRPTVAVVLGGGGAKGAAHVGVLKYLEEKGIPVDMIGGTSMGGLVGGMYSLGHSADRLKDIFLNADWNIILSDKTSMEYLSWEQRKHKATYPLTIPFNFKNGQYKSLQSSLPDGGIYGLNIYNILNSLSANYQNEMSFSNLPIPYYCVATEVNTMKERNIFSGVLSEAVRTTIAIPLYFKPVRKENGEILLDGGMRNNFPVDIALAAGADIVIGVDLRTETGDLDHAGQLLMQTLFGIGNDAYNATKDLPNVYIHPDMTGYWTMSFSKEEIADIVQRGYDAAKGCEEQIDKIKERLGKYTLPEKKKAIDLNFENVKIGSIAYEGLSDKEMRYLDNKISIKPGSEVDAQDINMAISTIHSTGSFKAVKYRLTGEEGQYTLVFECQKGPKHILSLAGRADSEQILAVQLKAGFWHNTVSGFRTDVTFKIANSPKLIADFSYRPIAGPELGLALSTEYGNVRQFNYYISEIDKVERETFNFWNHTADLYLQDSQWSRLQLKAGLFTQLTTRIDNLMDFTYYANIRFNSKDREDFPTRGWEFYCRVDRVFNQYAKLYTVAEEDPWDWTGHKAVYTVLGANVPISFTDRLTLLLSATARDITVNDFGNRGIVKSDASYFRSNVIGGTYDGIYFTQQVKFFGKNGVLKMEDKMIVGDAELRARFGKKHYVSLLGGAFVDGPRWDELGKVQYAVGVQYALPTPVGKLSVNVHYNTLAKTVGAYVGIGYNF